MEVDMSTNFDWNPEGREIWGQFMGKGRINGKGVLRTRVDSLAEVEGPVRCTSELEPRDKNHFVYRLTSNFKGNV